MLNMLLEPIDAERKCALMLMTRNCIPLWLDMMDSTRD